MSGHLTHIIGLTTTIVKDYYVAMQRGPDYGKRKEREKQFSVWLPMEVWERLRTRAFKDRRSMATLTRAAISQYLNRGGK